jgi:adenylate cyclase
MISPADVFHGKILIVDDQEANVLLLEQMLRGGGYDAISSTMDSSQVCELHLLNRYDLILLDLHMPGMDGFQVMENLKQIEAGSYLPVLVITAQADHKLRALKAGAKDFVSKPFDLGEVLARVYNMLEVRLLHLETVKLYDRVRAEQKVSERLLVNVLSPSLAQRLHSRPESDSGGPELIQESYAEVTALFANIVEFTRFAEGTGIAALVGVFNDISARFGGSVDSPGLDRIRTIGDTYLAAQELSDSAAERTVRAGNMALEMVEAVDRFNEHGRFRIKLRIGFTPTGSAGARKRVSRFDV